MSRIRSDSTGVGLRLRSIAAIRRAGGEINSGPGRDCTGNPLGERLGIAAIYAGQGDADSARAAALLVCAGVSDTPDNRALVLNAMDEIRNAVRVAVGVSGGPV